VLAVALVASIAFFGLSGSAGAMTRATTVDPLTITSVCVKSSGELFYLSPCGSRQTSVSVGPGATQFKGCYRNSTGVTRKVSASTICKSNETAIAKIPPDSGSLYFCVAPNGAMYFTGTSPPTCASNRFAVVIGPHNTPPVANGDAYSTDEDTLLSVTAPGVLSNDTDAESDPLTAVLVAGPSHSSSFTLNSDGSFSYTPAANYNGSDSFTYKANDGFSNGNTATVDLTVNAVNDAPVNSVPAAQSVDENATLTFSSGNSNLISTGDVDAGSAPVKITLGVSHGALTLSATTGLSFTTGDGTSDASMVFTGTLTDVNAALSGLVYAPTTEKE
jgi:VCBS repeat-containing protein